MMRRVTVCFVALLVSVLAVCACDSKPEPQAPATPPPAQPRAPLIKKQEVLDWCVEHGVPESICTRCNEALIEGFKKRGDWCKEHGLPDSQCFIHHPELEAKFLAQRPKGTESR